jgi:hypothetical protein
VIVGWLEGANEGVPVLMGVLGKGVLAAALGIGLVSWKVAIRGATYVFCGLYFGFKLLPNVEPNLNLGPGLMRGTAGVGMID